MRVVIIGGGSAGTAAAVHLRRRDENAEIILIEKSNEFAISSCGLPYMLAGKIQDKDELVGATAEQMRTIFKIDVRLNTEVLTIDPKEKRLSLNGGDTLEYSRLIIAAGSLQLRPDIPGILSDNIFTLHNLFSAQKIIDYFWGLNAKNVIILGGSEIGLRVAEALAANGAKITLIDKAAHILSSFDYDFARMFQQKLEDAGITVLTNTSVKEFLPDKAVLSNGNKIKYDMAVVTAGSKSEVRLPIISAIEIGETGGITVNGYMETSVPDILACGDNVETVDLITNLPFRINDAQTAIRSAKTAADNAVGIQTRMDSILQNRIIKIFGFAAGKAGCNEDELRKAGIPYRKLYLNRPNSESYLETSAAMQMKLLFGIDGMILGLQICGQTGVFSRLNAVAALMTQRATVQSLSEMPIAYFPEFAKAKDAVNTLGSLAEEINFGYLKTASLDDLKSGDLLLNVCSPDNFNQFFPKQAINIPLAALRDNLSILPRGKKIIVTGCGGYDAYLAYQILNQRGFEQTFLLNSADIWQ